MTAAVTITAPGILSALDGLGQSVGDVTDALLTLGIDGIPERSSQCPIARYLHEVFHVRFEVSGLSIYTCDPAVPGEIEVSTPEPIELFIDAFDQRDIPELIQPDPHSDH